ncbi:hypothetical protein MKX01_017896 [Papaver californicum]|nr:hypothetical protein MKX01_017896 [Papaver californicum]
MELPDPANPETIIQWAVCKLCGEKKKLDGTAGTSHLRRYTTICSKRRRVDKSQTTIAVNGQGTSGTSVGFSTEGSSMSSGSTFWEARNRQKRDPLATTSEELKRYYAEPEPALDDIENFDVLDWWKSNAKRYPVLSCITRDVLAAQASTVASESTFSLKKRILGDYRSSLTPNMLECSVILKDWWRAEMKEIYKPIHPLNDDITPLDEVERLAT